MKITLTLAAALLLALAPGAQQRPDWHRQATGHIAKGEYQQALARIETALARKPELVSALLLQGYTLLKLNRPEPARRAYRQALAKERTGGALAGLATAEYLLGNHRQALAAAAEALAAGAPGAGIHKVGASSLTALGRPQAAISWWRQACRMEPGELDNFRNLAATLLEANRAKEALALVAETVRTFGCRPELLRLEAAACIELGRDGEAADQLQALIALGLATPREIGALGDLRLRLGNPVAAIELYDLARRRGISGRDHQRRCALAHWHAGQLKRAAELLAGLKDSASPEELAELGDLRAALNQHAKALDCYAKALQAEPELTRAILGAGRSCLALRRFTQGIRHYRTLLSMGRKRVAARLGLAAILEEQGRLREGLAQLRRARSEAPADGVIMAEILRLERALARLDRQNRKKQD